MILLWLNAYLYGSTEGRKWKERLGEYFRAKRELARSRSESFHTRRSSAAPWKAVGESLKGSY